MAFIFFCNMVLAFRFNLSAFSFQFSPSLYNPEFLAYLYEGCNCLVKVFLLVSRR